MIILSCATVILDALKHLGKVIWYTVLFLAFIEEEAVEQESVEQEVEQDVQREPCPYAIGGRLSEVGPPIAKVARYAVKRKVTRATKTREK